MNVLSHQCGIALGTSLRDNAHMSMDPGQIVSRLARADTELRLLRRATLDLRAAGQVALQRRRRMTDEPGRSGRDRTESGAIAGKR